jgi:outer membrane biosynthesis protein TonB
MRTTDRRGTNRLVRRAAAVVTSMAGCLAVVALAAAGEGSPAARVDLRSGGAWVGSTVGLMTLIDGDSGEVVARVDVGDQSPALVSTQHGTVGYAVDGATGSVVRVDPRTFVASRPVRILERPSGQVSAYAGRRAVYILDEHQGRVAVADPDDMSRLGGQGQSLAEPVASSVVDDDGRLWLLGASSGDLAWFDGDRRHDSPGLVEHPEGAALVLAGGSPVVVDPGARTVHGLDREGRLGREVCLDVAPGDGTVRFGGSPERRWVYAISGEQGVLRVSDLDSGACKDVAVQVFSGGSDLGEPLESQGRVFVPNYTDGTVAIVDVKDGDVVVTPEPVAEGRFELFDEDGIVFYNDPDSERAGVIHLDGTVTEVGKYNPADPTEDVDNRPPADEPEEVPAPDAQPLPDATDTSGPPPPPTTTPPAQPPDTRPARPDEHPPPTPPPTPSTTQPPPESTPTTPAPSPSPTPTPTTPTTPTPTTPTTPTPTTPMPTTPTTPPNTPPNVSVNLAEMVYPVLSMEASASDPETSVRQITLYLELRYDCIDSASGEPISTESLSGAYQSAAGGSISATYNVWDHCSGYGDNFSGRVRASATDSQGMIGWSAWVPIYFSPF